MNRIILIVLVVGVVSTVGYLVATKPAVAPGGSDAANDMSSDELTTMEENETVQSARGTFAAFLERDGSGQCTFASSVDGVESEGDFWFANGMMRVEALTRVEGEVYTSNIINDGERVYIWGGTAEGTQAMVMDADMSATSYESYATESDARVDMNQEVTYTCANWSPNAVQFVPPSDIEFIDMQTVMSGYFDGELRGVPEGMDF